MSRKTRKLIWSAPLLAIFAVAAALVIFAALPPDGAQATHEDILDAPTALSAKAVDGDAGRNAIAVSWIAPSGTVTGYRIDYSNDNVEWKQLVADTGNTDVTYRHSGLKIGTQYIYRVFALSSAGVGKVSETYSALTKGAANKPSKVTGLTASVPTSSPEKWHQINLSWNEADGGGKDITGYCIEVTDHDTLFQSETAGCRASSRTELDFEAGEGDAAGVTLTGNAKTTYSYKGLDPNERRYFRVYGITSTGAS